MPLFSVVIPTYNRAELIPACLDSVFGQACTDYEVVVVDDGSTDDTLEVLASYGDRIRVVSRENGGEGAARNLGARSARGRYVAWLDSDDLWFPWTLSGYRRCIEQFDEPAVIMIGEVPFHDEDQLADVVEAPFRARGFPDFLAAVDRSYWTGVNRSAVRTDVLRRHEGFLEDRIVGLDIDFLMRAGAEPGYAEVLAPPGMGYREHGGNLMKQAPMIHGGIARLIDRERQGVYPGGRPRCAERRRVIGFHVRAATLRFLEAGRIDLAWDLYRKTVAWQLRQGRWRYLLGAPVLALRTLLTRPTGRVGGRAAASGGEA